MPNVIFDGPARDSSWRRLAIGAWGKTSDPTIYGMIDLDATAMLARIEAERTRGVHLTVTHIFGRAVAECFARCPDLNVVMRGSRAWQRASVDVFVQVALLPEDGDPAKSELSGVKITSADKLTLREFAERTQAQVELTRKSRNQAIDKTRKNLARTPRIFVRPLLRLARWLNYELNLDLEWLGVTNDPFGSVAITNVGMFGIETGFAPLFPIGGPPVVFTVGAITDRVVVVDGKIVVRPTLRVGGTFDHRVIDGYHISHLARHLRKTIEVEVADSW